MSLSVDKKEETLQFLELQGGLIVPWPVLDWCLQLEQRGVVFRVSDGRIFPDPLSTLTDADQAFLTDHRWHVLALAEYAPDDLHLWRA